MLFIKQGKYGWQIGVKAVDVNKQPMQDGAGNTIYCNMKVVFTKGQEPKTEELDKYDTYNGDLYFKDSNGRFRKATFLPNVYKDHNGKLVKELKLYLGDWQFDLEEHKKTEPLEPNGEVQKPQEITFEQDSLPFY